MKKKKDTNSENINTCIILLGAQLQEPRHEKQAFCICYMDSITPFFPNHKLQASVRRLPFSNRFVYDVVGNPEDTVSHGTGSFHRLETVTAQVPLFLIMMEISQMKTTKAAQDGKVC